MKVVIQKAVGQEKWQSTPYRFVCFVRLLWPSCVNRLENIPTACSNKVWWQEYFSHSVVVMYNFILA